MGWGSPLHGNWRPARGPHRVKLTRSTDCFSSCRLHVSVKRKLWDSLCWAGVNEESHHSRSHITAHSAPGESTGRSFCHSLPRNRVQELRSFPSSKEQTSCKMKKGNASPFLGPAFMKSLFIQDPSHQGGPRPFRVRRRANDPSPRCFGTSSVENVGPLTAGDRQCFGVINDVHMHRGSWRQQGEPHVHVLGNQWMNLCAGCCENWSKWVTCEWRHIMYTLVVHSSLYFPTLHCTWHGCPYPCM